MNKKLISIVFTVGVMSAAFSGSSMAQEPGGLGCDTILVAIGTTPGPDGEHANVAAAANNLNAKLAAALAVGRTGPLVGLQNDMWGTIVDANGIVCAVANTGGANTGAQWLGSRVISAQKANTANAFTLNAGSNGIVPGLSLSTANLWAATQPGGSLFGLQFSNPVDTAVAYGDNAAGTDRGADTNTAPTYGTASDPLVGTYVGGINVFGGGVGLYDVNGTRIGGVGVSGDTSCADAVIAWRTRDALDIDNVPAGVSPTGDDNIIHDLVSTNPGHTNSGFASLQSAGGFGHPVCGFGADLVSPNLPDTHPVD